MCSKRDSNGQVSKTPLPSLVVRSSAVSFFVEQNARFRRLGHRTNNAISVQKRLSNKESHSTVNKVQTRTWAGESVSWSIPQGVDGVQQEGNLVNLSINHWEMASSIKSKSLGFTITWGHNTAFPNLSTFLYSALSTA